MWVFFVLKEQTGYDTIWCVVLVSSPFSRGLETGLMSTRTPIFRSLPRVGIPPYYDGWEGWRDRVGSMVASGVIADYTYLWYNGRPHPNRGTVEIRAMAGQTRADQTIALR